ncbi:amidohydrolase family protein [Asticcacaulis sp. DXS10W]|uniref:Amidohydrolase family protein n=1 Tax=Asticcacaulis currens TaxID=2984210 RepID=A0ABT5I948_9CAUL|nr:amidohydrolase family protein [Asticcacaulis currens]MDC7692715.1 amidohydrolase family protein [Asticcacaulis currens]
MTLPFIDAHIHLWDLDHLRYAWLSAPFDDTGVNGSTQAIASTYLPSHYRVDAAGFDVRGTVHIDAGAHPDDALAETEWLQKLHEQTGLPTAIVAFAGLNDVKVEALLYAHSQHSAVRGIRHILNWHSNPYFSYTPANLLEDPQWRAGYAKLARYGLSFDLQIYENQMASAAALAARHPDIPVMLNHAGMPVNDGDGYLERWTKGLKALADVPHVSVKISGMGFSNRHWTTDTIRPLVLSVIDIFGTDRVMFASDVPTDKLFSDYKTIMTSFEEVTKAFSEDERRAMFAGNANRLYRLNLPL